MDNISNLINNMFETLFKKNSIHPFFNDLIRVHKLSQTGHLHMKNHIRHTIDYIEQNIPEKIDKVPIYKVLNKHEIKKLDSEINNVLNYNKILELVSYMSQFIIKSNVKDENKLYEVISKDNKINIIIIGSGPTGLFLACYLYLYYNNTKMNSSPRVNVVVYDSRISKSGFRKPYNRNRKFSTSSEYLNLIIPKLYCWDDNKEHITVNIFMLEYILYMVATNHYNIPIIYENYDWDDYVDIIDKGKFDVVFDCTGGKLKHNAIKNINPKWLKDINLYNSDINRTLEIIPDKNLVVLQNDSNTIVNYYYGSLTLHYNNSSLTFYENFDIDIMNKHDLMFLHKLKNKYFTYENSITIIKGIKSDITRNYLFTALHKNKDHYKKFVISFDVWGIYIRHAIKISDVFKVNNRNILFIGAGDTIFHSHFIIGAGLNRIFDFTVKCANLLAGINK
jgi:hypothetical protein